MDEKIGVLLAAHCEGRCPLKGWLSLRQYHRGRPGSGNRMRHAKPTHLVVESSSLYNFGT